MKNDSLPDGQTAVFAGGCFWCIEAVFLELDGVEAVESGYMGGATLNPTYREICSGDSGHAEVIRIIFDPAIVSFRELLEVFFAIHDPTTLNRQGNDSGTQYRSAIFYTSEEQKREAENFIATLTAQRQFGSPIVTEISPSSTFYRAEDYHQDYYQNNRSQPYCRFVVEPKLTKFRNLFPLKRKPN